MARAVNRLLDGARRRRARRRRPRGARAAAAAGRGDDAPRAAGGRRAARTRCGRRCVARGYPHHEPLFTLFFLAADFLPVRAADRRAACGTSSRAGCCCRDARAGPERAATHARRPRGARRGRPRGRGCARRDVRARDATRAAPTALWVPVHPRRAAAARRRAARLLADAGGLRARHAAERGGRAARPRRRLSRAEPARQSRIAAGTGSSRPTRRPPAARRRRSSPSPATCRPTQGLRERRLVVLGFSAGALHGREPRVRGARRGGRASARGRRAVPLRRPAPERRDPVHARRRARRGRRRPGRLRRRARALSLRASLWHGGARRRRQRRPTSPRSRRCSRARSASSAASPTRPSGAVHVVHRDRARHAGARDLARATAWATRGAGATPRGDPHVARRARRPPSGCSTSCCGRGAAERAPPAPARARRCCWARPRSRSRPSRSGTTWWGGFVLAIAEAGVVGGLADWFAVTAHLPPSARPADPAHGAHPARTGSNMAERVGVMVGGRVLTKEYVSDEIGAHRSGRPARARRRARLAARTSSAASRVVAAGRPSRSRRRPAPSCSRACAARSSEQPVAPLLAAALRVARREGLGPARCSTAALAVLADAMERPEFRGDGRRRHRRSARPLPRAAGRLSAAA